LKHCQCQGGKTTPTPGPNNDASIENANRRCGFVGQSAEKAFELLPLA
jgi:hypothetical protein